MMSMLCELGDEYQREMTRNARGTESELIARKKREAVHECENILMDVYLAYRKEKSQNA